MAYLVEDASNPRRAPERGRERSYVVQWDPDSAPTDVRSEGAARLAVLSYLNRAVKNTVTGAERLLGAEELPGENERRLLYTLDGFPANDLGVDEVDDSMREAFIATARWSYDGSLNERSVVQQAALNNSMFGGGPEADPEEGQATASYEDSAAPATRAIDYAPVRHLFVRGEIPGIAPGFPEGALNPEYDDSGEDNKKEGRVKIRGLEYEAPAVDIYVRLEAQGAPVHPTFRRKLRDAARAGVLNSGVFTIEGQEYAAEELLFCLFNYSRSTAGKTNIELGFASGEITVLDAEQVDVPLAVGQWQVDLDGKIASRQDGDPFWIWQSEATLVAPEDTLSFSPFDHVQQYHAPVEIPDGDSTRTVTRIQAVSINRLWATMDYEELFGTTSLNVS